MKKIIVCNQKMFLTPDEALEIKKELQDYKEENLVICPNYLNFNIYKDFNICSPDCFYENEGAYTSKISPYHLFLLGCKYALLGHSEVREFDTDEIINKKVKAALNNNMIPIICIGETKIEKEMNRTLEVIRRQINKSLKDVTIDKYQEIIIAYEPRWLIGTKNKIKKEDIIDIFGYISKLLNNLNIFNFKLLYGGNVNSESIKQLDSEIIDGYLLGNASKDSQEIINILKM